MYLKLYGAEPKTIDAVPLSTLNQIKYEPYEKLMDSKLAYCISHGLRSRDECQYIPGVEYHRPTEEVQGLVHPMKHVVLSSIGIDEC